MQEPTFEGSLKRLEEIKIRLTDKTGRLQAELFPEGPEDTVGEAERP